MDASTASSLALCTQSFVLPFMMLKINRKYLSVSGTVLCIWLVSKIGEITRFAGWAESQVSAGVIEQCDILWTIYPLLSQSWRYTTMIETSSFDVSAQNEGKKHLKWRFCIWRSNEARITTEMDCSQSVFQISSSRESFKCEQSDTIFSGCTETTSHCSNSLHHIPEANATWLTWVRLPFTLDPMTGKIVENQNWNQKLF